MHSNHDPNRPWRLLLLLLFSSGFLFTSALLSTLGGHPDLGLLDDKLQFFEANKDRYDLVFFGSSRVYRGVIPPLFDAEVAARGRTVRSFNFGIAGMQPHEANALIRRVLALEPGRLRWVVVELDDWDPDIHHENRFKRRGVFWHDLPETLSAMRSTLLLDAPATKRLDLLGTHALHLAVRTLGIGRGPDIARRATGTETSSHANDSTFSMQGYEPFSERSYEFHPIRRQFLDNLDAYATDVARLSVENARTAALHHYNHAALTGQVAMLRRAGIEPVHLIPPIPDATPRLFALRSQGAIPRLLAFNDPIADGELLDIGRRFDRDHLTHEGAEAFTRSLAKRFSAVALARHAADDPPVRRAL